MFYVDDNYSNFIYLIEASDNYLILSDCSHISGASGDSDSVSAIIQYFTPSFVTIPIIYTSEDSFKFINVSDFISTSVYDRADFPLIFTCGFIILFIFAFVLNQLSKLVYKGGLFGSN